MQPLNPFLRALFASRVPSQCTNRAEYIILAPTTEFIAANKDRETQTDYADLCQTEEFIASHVLHASGEATLAGYGNDGHSLREVKSRARPYTTINGKTVVIKDVTAYTNKGFKNLHQAQILQDELYSTGANHPQWLIYYISRPLLGSPQLIKLLPKTEAVKTADPESSTSATKSATSPTAKGQPKTFDELLTQFPLIARQIRPELKRLLQVFRNESDFSSQTNGDGLKNGTNARGTLIDVSEDTPLMAEEGLQRSVSAGYHEALRTDEERDIRSALEALVMAAINLFRQVDRQQLANLGSTTGLSGTAVEQMIERHVTEEVHEKTLFPRIREARQELDAELNACIKRMVDLDISQIGVEDDLNTQDRRELCRRIDEAISIFKKLSSARSPQEMGQILLATERCLSRPSTEDVKATKDNVLSEKASTVPVMNADMLVSLLLIVVVRSPVRNLNAHLAYMRAFVFLSDVESGELGYVLSTLEAVLTYMSSSMHELVKISQVNRTLWSAVKKGEVDRTKALLDSQEPLTAVLLDGIENNSNEPATSTQGSGMLQTLEGLSSGPSSYSQSSATYLSISTDDTTLSHVYPFMTYSNDLEKYKPKLKKRVSMDLQSISGSSVNSFSSFGSNLRLFRHSSLADLGPDKLAKTRDTNGSSVLMMAIDAKQPEMFDFLLNYSTFFTPHDVLQDCKNDGTNLLSAALQMRDRNITDNLLDYVVNSCDDETMLRSYLAHQDTKGRSAGHYIYDTPELIPYLGKTLPWRLKDHNGQTPLFALCRSYDQEDYASMVQAALNAATEHQADGQRLHLDEHIDNKKNTLLHIVHDPRLLRDLLHTTDADPNACNDRQFTPIMLNSKFARLHAVRILFQDERVETQLKDARGLSAVELAKDDEVRNQIDDMVLLATIPMSDDRHTTIVRSLFVEDGSVRMILKSGSRNSRSSITVTTCRRSQLDFLNLIQCLGLEHPASWLPSLHYLRSPFQIPSKPSRQILRDTQLRLEGALQALVSHPTFSTHETLWEFFLVPDVVPAMQLERAHRKAEARVEKLREDYEPLIADRSSVSVFVNHARDQISALCTGYIAAADKLTGSQSTLNDLATAFATYSKDLKTLDFLPASHTDAFALYTSLLVQTEASPYAQLQYVLLNTISVVDAIHRALLRPRHLLGSMKRLEAEIERARQSGGGVGANASKRAWGIATLLDDARGSTKQHEESATRVRKAAGELETLGRELRYTQTTVAAELAGWQAGHGPQVRSELRRFARRMVVVERERLAGMRRAMRVMRR